MGMVTTLGMGMAPTRTSCLSFGLILLVLAITTSTTTAQQTTVTLYDVSRPTPTTPVPGGTPAPPSQLFTPLGVGPDGATIYRNEVYISGSMARETKTVTSAGSVVTIVGPDRTSTVFATLVADATHLVYSHIPPEPTNPLEQDAFPPQILNCTLHGIDSVHNDNSTNNTNTSTHTEGAGGGGSKSKTGICEIRWWDQGGRATETFTSTFTGNAIPLYTLTVGQALPSTTPTPNVTTTSDGLPTSAIGGNATLGPGESGGSGNGGVGKWKMDMRVWAGLGVWMWVWVLGVGLL